MTAFPTFCFSIAKKMGLFYTDSMKFILWRISMNNLTLEKFEKSYINSSIITNESDIEDCLKKLIPYTSSTVTKAFSSFKYLLYSHSFYSFNNPTFNISNYYNKPKTRSTNSWGLENYIVPETFIPILKLVFNYFSSQQILTLTKSTNYFAKNTSDEITASTPVDYFTEDAYLSSEFTWKISLNFMPVFSAIVYGIYCCFNGNAFSMNNFLSKFTSIYTNPNKKIIFSNESDSNFFIDNQKSTIHIHTSKEKFIDILNSWADKYLAAPFFKNMDFLYATYAQNNSYYQILLYKSVQTLTATLINDRSIPEIYPDINALLENHMRHFPDASCPEEIKYLYPHEVLYRFTERELHLVENYIENTKTWNKELLLKLKKLIIYLECSSFSLQEKYNCIDQALSKQKDFVSYNSNHLENEINNEFNELSKDFVVSHSACSEHVTLIHNMLTDYTNKLISELDTQYSKLKEHYHFNKILLSDITSDIEHFPTIYTQNLTDDWHNLKNKDKFPVFMKIDKPGILNNPPFNFYAKTLTSEDVLSIVQQLNLDFKTFQQGYINSYNELLQAGILIPFNSPTHLALTLSQYHKLRSNS